MKWATLSPQKISTKEKKHLLKKAKMTNGGTIREAVRELIQKDMESEK
jgi:hypothetical protein